MDCPGRTASLTIEKECREKRDAQESFKQATGQVPGCVGEERGCQPHENVWLK